LCIHLQQVAVEETGLSTYELTLASELWLTTQRRNYRMFQQLSELDIVLEILREWQIEPVLRVDRAAYKKRQYCVQYGESDFAFLSRLLEHAGISFYCAQSDGGTKLVLCDAPERGEARGRKIVFRDNPTAADAIEHVTRVRIGQKVRPGRYT